MKKILFPHAEKWLLLLLPLIFFGFYPGYWSVLTQNKSTIQHIHAGLMCLWVIMSIVQPYLITKKKTELHKRTGKISYGLIPLIVLTGYILIQARYDRLLLQTQEKVTKGELILTPEMVLNKVAGMQSIGILFLFILLVCYILAIVNRKSYLPHATYMMGAIFTSIDPALDRLVSYWSNVFQIETQFFITYASQLFTMGLLISLAIYQRAKQQLITPALVLIGLYSICYLINNLASETLAWQWFTEALLFR